MFLIAGIFTVKLKTGDTPTQLVTLDCGEWGGKPPKTPIMPKNVKNSGFLSYFLFFASVEKEKQMAFCTK